MPAPLPKRLPGLSLDNLLRQRSNRRISGSSTPPRSGSSRPVAHPRGLVVAAGTDIEKRPAHRLLLPARRRPKNLRGHKSHQRLAAHVLRTRFRSADRPARLSPPEHRRLGAPTRRTARQVERLNVPLTVDCEPAGSGTVRTPRFLSPDAKFSAWIEVTSTRATRTIPEEGRNISTRSSANVSTLFVEAKAASPRRVFRIQPSSEWPGNGISFYDWSSDGKQLR